MEASVGLFYSYDEFKIVYFFNRFGYWSWKYVVKIFKCKKLDEKLMLILKYASNLSFKDLKQVLGVL